MRAFRPLVLLVGIGVVGGAVLAIVLLTGGDEQSKVEVQRGDALPAVTRLNRADDYGADVVRAYLQGALACSPDGARLVSRLSRHGETAAHKLVGDACARSGGHPFAERLRAEVAQEDLDRRGRSLWRVTPSDGDLVDDLILRVRQSTNGWEIERPCIGSCPP